MKLIFVAQAWHDWAGEGEGSSQLHPHQRGKLSLHLPIKFVITFTFFISHRIYIYAAGQEGKALCGGRWKWESTPREIHTDIEFAMNEVF